MSVQRILVVANARPSRAWRLAERIVQEVAGAEICGIVQWPERELPIKQQSLMRGGMDKGPGHSGRIAKATLWLRSMWDGIINATLTLVHGIPSGVHRAEFTSKALAEKCRARRLPFLMVSKGNKSTTLTFIANQDPDLAIMLGDQEVSDELLRIPRRGWICVHHWSDQEESTEEGRTLISMESLSGDPVCRVQLAQLSLPHQRYDGAVSICLKADLICDDLALESVKQMVSTSVSDTAAALAKWTRLVFSPYLEQLQKCSDRMPDTARNGSRCRPQWKLFLDALLLYSPLLIARNWYRRLFRKYPITILTHHLVSDRPHRMGISTETFWRQVRFLQRHYRIVTLAEAVELLTNDTVDAPTLVFTFDDGYADNFVSLRAVAEETGIPITMFIATEPVTLQHEFAHDLENGIRGALPLTWEQLRYWSSGRVEFGAHTRTHFDCGSKDGSRLEFEIAGSKLDLEEQLLRSVDFFAFPFGQAENMSAEASQIAQKHYRYFVSGFGGENHYRQSNNQHLRRKGLYANAWESELDLQGVFEIVDKIKSSRFLQRHRAGRIADRVSSPFATSNAASEEALGLIHRQ